MKTLNKNSSIQDIEEFKKEMKEMIRKALSSIPFSLPIELQLKNISISLIEVTDIGSFSKGNREYIFGEINIEVQLNNA